jgi:hypothetical protein
MHLLSDRERSSFALQRAFGYCRGLYKLNEADSKLCCPDTEFCGSKSGDARIRVLQTLELRERNGLQRKTVLRGIP